MNKARIYAIIGIAVVAAAAGIFSMLNQDLIDGQIQDRIQIPGSNTAPIPQVVPQIPEQPSKPSDDWAEQPATFKDSTNHIPEVVVSHNWTNGDALQACRLILEDPTILETSEQLDLNWCREFVQAHTNS
jgi:hypothetical protein